MAPEDGPDLRGQIRELQQRLDEAEETLRALRSGEVDAIVVSGPEGDRVYTLKGADETYRVIVEGMAEGALTVSTDGLILFSNQQFANMAGTPLAHVIGGRVQDFFAPGDVASVAAFLAGGEGKAEARLQTSGGLLPVHLSAHKLAVGGLDCVCLVVADLSEQKRRQELAALMEAVPAALFIAEDPDCRKMVGSRMAYEFLGVPSGGNLSLSAQEGARPTHYRAMANGREIPPEDLPVQTAARTGRAVHGLEFDLVFDDGRTRCWFGNAVPLLDETGKPRGAVGAFIDITERREAEARLRETQKMESLGVMAGGLAHDFNNLLVGVMGNASMAQDVLPPGHPAAQLMESVVSAGEELATLTRQMLAYSGKGRLFVERLDLSTLIPRMSGLVQPSLPKDITLQFDLAPDLPPVEADRGQVQQIFTNLVINAAEAIDGKAGHIHVTTGVQEVDSHLIRRHPELAELSPGAYVCLSVRDDGCGMDEPTQSKIFDPFFSTKFAGRGLGLAAASGIVRGHKGAIQVTSEPGRGSCFTVLLPTAPVRREPDKPRTILVVDDEKVVRDVAQSALRRSGFEVLLATGGAEALDLLKRHREEVSLVVLDLSMPGLSGRELVAQIHDLKPAVPILVSSGYDEAQSIALFHGQRIAGFVQKPYSASRFVDKVKSLLG